MKGKEFVLPIYELDSNLVLLPGIIYNVTFSRFKAAALLSRFKSKVSISMVNNIINEYEFNKDDYLSEDSIHGIENYNKIENDFDWLVLGITPNFEKINVSKNRVVTIVKVIGINDENNNIRLTFQAMTRGERIKDYKNESLIRVDDIKFSADNLSSFKKLNNELLSLFDKIDSFLVDYKSTNNLLNLNPLANSLFLQLSTSNDFNKAYKSLKKLVTTVNLKDFDNLSKLIDLAVAILPFPIIQKFKILSKFSINERILELTEMIRNFKDILANLQKDDSFVSNWFFNEATNLQKAAVVASQLKSIRVLLDSISEKDKNNKQLIRKKSNFSNTPNPGANGRRSGNNNMNDDDDEDDLQGITTFIKEILPNISLSEDSKRLILKDYKRIKSSSPGNSDFHVIRNYLDIVSDLPWDKYISKFKHNLDIDIEEAKRQLDNDHHGLENVKKRLIQYLVVLKLLSKKINDDFDNNAKIKELKDLNSKDLKELKDSKEIDDEENLGDKNKMLASSNKSPIIMLAGPPGIGKTSLAKSIAKSLGRNFQRISLGGIKDESEIRGHRRTYVGAMPGVIVQSLRKAKSMNPVILLDEIDKVIGGNNTANKFNGDPSAALLEVLDPEQNSSFVDHYLGFPIDLSQVIFICTANEPYNLSRPLLDRLEMIELSAYDYHEKLIIGKKYLLPRQIKRNGLPENSLINISDEIMEKIINNYTREAGVRNLERKLGTICRYKAVEYSKSLDNKETYQSVVEEFDLPKYLGIPLPNMSLEIYDTPNQYGIVNGLSYNGEGSGSVLSFESIGFINNEKGGSLNMTGRLGEVLMESGKIGLVFIKSIIYNGLLNSKNQQELMDRFKNLEIHLHVPMGSISKDGPSAGITMALSFLSLILEKPVPKDIAMTGEITLRGMVLPIGGLKEKMLGAHLSGIKRMIVPRNNRKDLIEEYIKSINDDSQLNAILKDDEKKYDFENNEPELYFASKYGIKVNYANEFWDVIKLVWGDELIKDPIRLIEYHL